MIKNTVLAAAAALVLSANAQVAQAASDCPPGEVRNIQKKFDDRLSYEARRAQRRELPTTSMINGFRNVDRHGSCSEVFERHRAYIERWAKKIDQG
ncbi:MAG: hypothetical protein AAF501_01665 [Pseudomonadota bacterium]